VIDQGVLDKLPPLLRNPRKAIRKEACWTVSNVTAGNVAQIEAIIHSSLFELVSILLDRGEFDVKKEAAWAVANATSGGTPQQIRFLVSTGCVPPLCALLSSISNEKVIMVALEGLENILKVGEDDKPQTENVNKFAQIVEECGGLESLENLQTADLYEHGEEIYERAVVILRKFFCGEYEDEAYVKKPNVDNNTNTFQFNTDDGDGDGNMAEDTNGFNF